MNRKLITNAKRIIIKFGTNVLRNDCGELSLPRIYSFIEDIAMLQRQGKEVIIVTSGAVGLGKKKLGLKDMCAVGLKQACAAIGQSKLMQIYSSGFDAYDITVAQILLTEEDFSNREKYLSLRNTLNELLDLGVVPIINENDTVSTAGLSQYYCTSQVSFSDNDKLSALVASELDADLLLMISDVDGLYDSNPKTDPEAEIISEVKKVSKDILSLGQDASSGGRGGMKTKLEAARVVTHSGGTALIANGKRPFIIKDIFNEIPLGTIFLPEKEMLSGKKRWIGYASGVLGKVVVNEGAKKAILQKESSLLPIGIVDVLHEFEAGDVVSILDEDNVEIARGMVNYCSSDCRKIIGLHSNEILKVLGYKNYDAFITRDNITILENN